MPQKQSKSGEKQPKKDKNKISHKSHIPKNR